MTNISFPCRVLFLTLIATHAFGASKNNFKYKITPIPASVQKLMKQYTWKPECPVPLQDLSYIKLSYWGFDHKVHEGILIVHKKIAGEIVDIFHELYKQQFPIERMQALYAFKGDDNAAMAANNTSAFNCRPNTTYPNQYSLHSYGYAIDINPMLNPYVKGDEVLPPAGKPYLDRTHPVSGMITQDSLIFQSFIKRGWAWGGNFEGRTDYQHFQKIMGLKNQ